MNNKYYFSPQIYSLTVELDIRHYILVNIDTLYKFCLPKDLPHIIACSNSFD